jgi:hypothetical protein
MCRHVRADPAAVVDVRVDEAVIEVDTNIDFDDPTWSRPGTLSQVVTIGDVGRATRSTPGPSTERGDPASR